MSFKRLIDHLNSQQAKFSLEVHSQAYTAQEVAERAHIHGLNMGKVVVIKVDGEFALCLLPSHFHVDCKALASELEARDISIAHESEFVAHFPQCETGAIPPFSALWEMPVYMSFAFDVAQDIYFNAGNWSEIVHMSCEEYIRVEQPKVISEGAQAPGMTPPKVSRRRGREAYTQH